MKSLPTTLLLLVFALPLAQAEDCSDGVYASVYAKRLLIRSDDNGNGRVEKAEAEREWRSLASLDVDRDEALSLPELIKATIPYLPSDGERKLNLLYKKTVEEDLYLDLYYPADKPAGKLPVVVYTHGGGWTTGSKQGIASVRFRQVYSALLAKGYAVAAVNYRLYRKDESVTIRDCVIDAKDAVRYLAQHSRRLGLDPQRFVVHGDSAGGQIAQLLLLSSPESLSGDSALADVDYRMLAGVSWYGPSDFERVDLFNHDDKPDFHDRFGPRIVRPDTAPHDRLARYREMSPVRYLQANSPPLLLIQGDRDTTIPAKHAYYMKSKAETILAPVAIMIIENAGHNWREVGAPIKPTIDEIIQRTVGFLTEHSISTNKLTPP